MSHTPYDKFRDYAGMTQWVTRGIFPALSMEFEQDWKDRGLMRRPFLLERVVLGDRAASTRTPMFTLTQRNNAELFKLPGSPHWWAPVRSNMVQFAGEDPTKQYNNVITYISRQEWGRRKLRQEDHEVLVTALNKLKEQYGYEVNIVSAENLTRDQQIRLAGRTTVSLVLSLSLVLHVLICRTDYDRCTRKWLNIIALDEALPKSNCYGVLLSGRVRA